MRMCDEVILSFLLNFRKTFHISS